MASLSLQEIYDAVQLRQAVQVQCNSETDYNSLRTALLRKFRKTREIFTAHGFDAPMDSEYLSCKLDKATLMATFQLQDKNLRKTRPRVWSAESF